MSPLLKNGRLQVETTKFSKKIVFDKARISDPGNNQSSVFNLTMEMKQCMKNNVQVKAFIQPQQVFRLLEFAPIFGQFLFQCI